MTAALGSISDSNDHCKDFRPYAISRPLSVTRPGTSQPVQGGLMRKGLETTVAESGSGADRLGVVVSSFRLPDL